MLSVFNKDMFKRLTSATNKFYKKYIMEKPKIRPGRWGNVGDFIENDSNKEFIKARQAIITTRDHCADDKCCDPKYPYKDLDKHKL